MKKNQMKTVSSERRRERESNVNGARHTAANDFEHVPNEMYALLHATCGLINAKIFSIKAGGLFFF